MTLIAKAISDGARMFLRAPAFSIAVVVMLSLGIGVTASSFALVNAIMIRPLPYPDADRLVTIRHAAPRAELPLDGISPGLLRHYQTQSRTFDQIAFYQDRSSTITDPGDPGLVRVATVSPEFFGVLGARPFLGRFPIEADAEFQVRTPVVISHAFWMARYGGDPDAIGRSLTIESWIGLLYVTGVAEPGFHFPDPETQVWVMVVPAQMPARARAGIRGLVYKAVARLKPDVSAEDAASDLQGAVRRLPDVFPDVTSGLLEETGFHAVVTPLKEAMIGDVRVPLQLLLATACFLLLITWANVVNLSLVRAERNHREVAIARALGATMADLARRFIGESAMLAFPAGTIALALVSLAVGVRFGLEPDRIPRLGELTIDASVLTIVALLSIGSAIFIGAAGLLSAWRADMEALKGAAGRMTGGVREQWGRRILVAAQMALALPLLIAATLLAQSFWRLSQADLGFQPDGAIVFTVPFPPSDARSGDFYLDSARVHGEIRDRLRSVPGVTAVDSSTIFPLTHPGSRTQVRITTADASDRAPYAMFSFASPDYFRTVGIPLLAGRQFERRDMSAQAPGAILSVSLARALFGERDPVGRTVQWPAPSQYQPYIVVGVVGDIAAESLHEGPSRVLYFPNVYPPQADKVTGVISNFIPDIQTYVVRTTLPLTSLAPAIQRVVRDVGPNLVVTGIGTAEDLVAQSRARTRVTMLLLLIGAGTALLLGVMGIYGVLAYAVSQRRREFAVRLALGAQPRSVVSMVIRQGIMLALFGTAIGVPLALGLTGFLGSLLYEVAPHDFAVFTAMTVLLMAVAVAASYVPAHRAAALDPLEALRAE